MVNKLDYGEFLLNTAITNSSTLASINVTARYTEHDLTKDRATGLLTAGAIVMTNPNDLGQKEKIYFSNATADGTDSLGRAKYILTVDTADDASTKRRGTANDDDGTDAVANVISGNMYAFPKNSPARITWEVGELTALENTFEAGSSVTQSIEAGENIAIRESVSLHSDGKWYKYHKTNYPNLKGIATEAMTAGSSYTIVTWTGLSTGHSGLTPGATQYAENTGAITETSSVTTTILGDAETATTIRVAKAADSETEFNDNEFKIKDNSDATKVLDFQLSGITTATTRTVTMPDEDITIAGIVDEDDMSSDSATKVPSQQSVKAYVDGETSGAGTGIGFLFSEKTDFTESTSGTGSVANSTTGIDLEGGATSGSEARIVRDFGYTDLLDSKFTMSFVVSTDNHTTDHGNNGGFFIGFSSDSAVEFSSDVLNGFQFIKESGALNIYGRHGTTQELLTTFTNGNVYELCMTYDGSGEIKYYVNKTLEATVSSAITASQGRYLNAAIKTWSTDGTDAKVRSMNLRSFYNA